MKLSWSKLAYLSYLFGIGRNPYNPLYPSVNGKLLPRYSINPGRAARIIAFKSPQGMYNKDPLLSTEPNGEEFGTLTTCSWHVLGEDFLYDWMASCWSTMYFEVGAASLEECRINTWTIIRFVENSMAHGWFLLILLFPFGCAPFTLINSNLLPIRLGVRNNVSIRRNTIDITQQPGHVVLCDELWTTMLALANGESKWVQIKKGALN